MTELKSKLNFLKNNTPEKNVLNSYFPIRTNEKPFNWNAIVGLLIQALLRKKIGEYTLESFECDCEQSLKTKLSDESFWDVLREMYFVDGGIFDTNPEIMLLKSKKGDYNPVDERIAKTFYRLLAGIKFEGFDIAGNFIEKEFLAIFRYQLDKINSHAKHDKREALFLEETEEVQYLPDFSKAFRKDFLFLISRQKYFLAELKNFLCLYLFTYTAQLSLSLGDWRSCKAPSSKPLFFIMDHERASKERVLVNRYGYNLLSESLVRVFPILTMLEMLQPCNIKKVPLWELARIINEEQGEDLIISLSAFADAFKIKRGLSVTLKERNDALDLLGDILWLAEKQFKSGGKKGLDDKYASSVEKLIAGPFIQNRRRSGRVLVLNQDHIILLTNLVVGEEDKLRFHDLLEQFKLRGVFVDKQTELELIKFYERIGNVERMSDSGDAVYVRKTI
ncbi:DNA phosphorothioation-dependent restriction protein DptG [Shewanella algae]|uniref:DNA phosphorothioation-dependent restriction protein DptG n=1 Tax=Shewanella algae TaxID=38313 RepID=UPI003005E745